VDAIDCSKKYRVLDDDAMGASRRMHNLAPSQELPDENLNVSCQTFASGMMPFILMASIVTLLAMATTTTSTEVDAHFALYESRRDELRRANFEESYHETLNAVQQAEENESL
jgi:hypothetical protein